MAAAGGSPGHLPGSSSTSESAVFGCKDVFNLWAVRRSSGKWTVARSVGAQPTQALVPVGTPLDIIHSFVVGHISETQEALVKEMFVAADTPFLSREDFIERFGRDTPEFQDDPKPLQEH